MLKVERRAGNQRKKPAQPAQAPPPPPETPTGNDNVGVARGDEGSARGNGLVAADAGLGHRVRRDAVREPGGQQGLARHIAGLDLLDHRAADDIVHKLRVQLRALQQAPIRERVPHKTIW